MTRDWHQHPEAEEELSDAHDHFLQASGSDLSDKFSDKIESAIDLILKWPEAAPRFSLRRRTPVIRMLRVNGFPYSVVYALHKHEILVLAYAHEKRRPGYWMDRLALE